MSPGLTTTSPQLSYHVSSKFLCASIATVHILKDYSSEVKAEEKNNCSREIWRSRTTRVPYTMYKCFAPVRHWGCWACELLQHYTLMK
jgi:hypothetical protein